jgi:hypothetical protein
MLNLSRFLCKTANAVEATSARNRRMSRGAIKPGLAIIYRIGFATAGLLLFVASAAKAAPIIFNWSPISDPATLVSVQGSGFGSNPTVWCSTNGAPAVRMKVINGGDNDVQFYTPWPANGSQWAGQYAVTVKNGSKAGNTVYINQAFPMHFDTPEIYEGGAFRIFGRNLQLAYGTPVVEFVSGGNTYDATVNSGGTYNTLYCTAPASIPNGTYSVEVSNGLGTWATAAATCQEQMTVISAGPDTFNIGVPWSGDYSFGSNVYNVESDPRLSVHAVGNGANNDGPAIQDAINIASAAGGGVVYLPAGTFALMATSGPALVMANNVVIQGAGQSNTELSYGYGTPGSTFWAILFYGVSKCGLCDLSVVNQDQGGAWTTSQGSIATGSTCSELFMARVAINLGAAQQMFWSGDRVVVENSTLTATYTIMTIGGSTNFRVFGNTFTQMLGVNLDMSSVGGNQGVVENNAFRLNANNGAVVSGNVRHGMAIAFTHNLAILNNTWSVFNGTPAYDNDGESILSEGGGGNRIGEETGTVISADGTTVTTSQSIAYVAGTVIAIVNGAGAGQWRPITARSGSTITVATAWAKTPDNTSSYSIFIWSNQNTTISGNTFTDWLRGVWDYQGASTDTEVTGNTFNTQDGLIYRPCQNTSAGNGKFDPIWNNVCDHNTLSSSSSTATEINLTGDEQNTALFGTMALNDQFLDNAITGDNITDGGYEPNGPFENDPAWTEGYCNYFQVEPTSFTDQSIPAELGVIFQSNTANNCGLQAYLINGGDYRTTIANYSDTNDGTFLTDSDYYWNTPGTHGSVGTVIIDVPAAPTELTAVAGSAQVMLSWSAAVGAASYSIYRGTSSGGEGDAPIATGITTTSHKNGGRTDGTTYYYEVRAVNSSGKSEYSNEASATPVEPPG